MARILYLLLALAAYLLFLATFLYLIAFVGNCPWVPATVDRGGDAGSVALAVTVDLALIALFGLGWLVDLVSTFGEDYRSYRARTGMLAPRFGRKRAG